jgi:hypothetical protein
MPLQTTAAYISSLSTKDNKMADGRAGELAQQQRYEGQFGVRKTMRNNMYEGKYVDFIKVMIL